MIIRSAHEVFEDHLHLRAIGDLETDLQHNYADDIVLLCTYGVFRGCDQVRASAERLGLQLPDARFEYLARHVHEESAFLEWRAESDQVRVEDGADSYLIDNGRIMVQTIHDTLIQKSYLTC